MARKEPNPIDVHVGSRVRLRRLLVGMSQEKLGEQLGLTFQQVQKYEKGTNRIGASRLFEVSRILGVPVQYFYEELAPASAGEGEMAFAEGDGASFVMDFVSSSEGLQLNRAFFEIRDPAVRRSVIDLLKHMAKAQDVAAD
ncbi:helix-turn-helix transcriptional regulator [Pyruvatibacter sp.]|uniref:helix-turn-helix domain-containing protein n=1 Tax=Pyruvatibacter sp. TaxID=1981328 RepID=UPI0032EE32D2